MNILRGLKPQPQHSLQAGQLCKISKHAMKFCSAHVATVAMLVAMYYWRWVCNKVGEVESKVGVVLKFSCVLCAQI